MLIVEILFLLRDIVIACVAAVWNFLITPKYKDVKNEIVLITGSANGIGRGLALDFARRGCILVLWDIDEAENEKTAQLVTEAGAKAYPYYCDLSERKEIYRIGKKVQKEVGDVTILVNNAGVVIGKSFLECPDEEIENSFQVNTLAYFWTIKVFLPKMIEKNYGHIVNMSSSLGLTGINKLTDYCSTKFAVVGFNEVLSYELQHDQCDGIKTTLICPQCVKTRMFEGCKLRFPPICPFMELDYVVNKSMQAILTNQYILCLPRLVYFQAAFKAILPTGAWIASCRFFGTMTFMDGFVGNKKD
ncbi:epidermal retinol dehydrogenase 2-like [Octopus vulgaris]|uniref:Epidermal retinol dehydrogenase 2-like n=2 Tax=Octopus TaxID=6643 RepID=A0AA36AQK6_OCTVU|nr:epidermal retinol dehydrogenase 2-like [Octopus vulgaris]